MINGFIGKGYAAGDIAILARKNEEAKAITDCFLSLKNSPETIRMPFDVISDETLYLVQFVLRAFSDGHHEVFSYHPKT